MANKMLIDASHPEETRVVVLRGNRVEEFDFEAASKRQLRGNIYLAKVTRVEPSLQAAFVEYGGNRHGFLAFAEIHPDYYQIPVADRQALLAEEARAQSEDEDDERPARASRRRRPSENGDPIPQRAKSADETISEDAGLTATEVEMAQEHEPAASDTSDGEPAHEQHQVPAAPHGDEEPAADEPSPHDLNENLATYAGDHSPVHSGADDVAEEAHDNPANEPEPAEAAGLGAQEHQKREPRSSEGRSRRGRSRGPKAARDGEERTEEAERDTVDQMGGDAMEEVPFRAPRLRRQYKIQEVIKRRQVLLIQVVKEERGNKGAALTTYLSLAGRYSVLMPNTARGGGISRKITDAADRKRLKAIAQELEVPEGMGVILRTAGAARTKAEVKRDFEYLLRMWETVRELTLQSSAPTLVYEEGSLIKRAIRDLYNKDIDEVVVAGDEGYREAKEFMRMLMPSHAKNVKLYKDPQPIFAKAGAEAQLDAMFSNQVTLKSGGYIVINQTEALVAIDVNSGRSTREHNIEDTALRTNLEAADEVARQLRLRDLAGLIVVDFIDMDENRNNRAVEKRMKEALENDRARIQVGRISHFGLLEMSRQRIRTGVLEGSTITCPHCAGAGMVRATSSIALHVMRVLEDALIKNASYNLTVRTRTEVALYILNQKRSNLRELESRFGVHVTVAADDTLTGAVYHAIERGEPVLVPVDGAVRAEPGRADPIRPSESFISEEEEVEAPVEAPAEPPRQEGRRPEGRREGRFDNQRPRNFDRPNGEGRDRPVERNGQAERPVEEGEVARRRRRRRRRRGGGDRENIQSFAPNAPQPMDDGLAVMAEISGDFPAAPYEAEAELSAHPAEMEQPAVIAPEPMAEAAPRARRSSGRSRRAGSEPIEVADGVEAPATEAPRRSRRAGRAAAPVEAVSEDVAPAIMMSEPVASQTPEPPVASEPIAAPEPKPEPLPEAPVGPKRSGWWQKAKALGGF